MHKQKKFVIWGASGHAKVLIDLLTTRGDAVVALIDNRNVQSIILGVPLYIGSDGFMKWHAAQNRETEFSGVVAVGHCSPERMDIQRQLTSYGLQFPPIVHEHASLCANVVLGEGVQILAQAVVSAESIIGRGCIINHRACVDHECVLGEGVHVAPGATICGCVTVGTNVFVGAGAVILPRVTLGANSTIGAGAVVTRDVPAGATVVGNPASII